MDSITKISPNATAAAKFETTDELLTTYGGLIPILGAIRHSGSFRRLEKKLCGMKSRNRGFSVAEKLLSFYAHAFIGAERLEDFKLLSNDTALTKATGVGFFKPTTAGEFLRALAPQLAELSSFIFNESIRRYNDTSIEEETIDADSSLFYNDKDCAEYSYMKETAFNPMFLIGQREHIFLHTQFRNGNASPMSDIVEPLTKTLAGLSHLKRLFFRGDSAFFQQDVIRAVKAHPQARYTITARHNSSIIESFSTVETWNVLDAKEKTEVGETIGMLVNEPIRLIVKRTPKKPEDGQTELFEDANWRYYAVCTNFSEEEKSAKDVILFHNGRGNAENFFKELKNDYELKHFPCIDFDANAAYFYLRVIAFNALRALMHAHLLFPATWDKHMLGTIVFRFIHCAAKVVSHARSTTVRVWKGHPYIDVLRDAFMVSEFSTA